MRLRVGAETAALNKSVEDKLTLLRRLGAETAAPVFSPLSVGVLQPSKDPANRAQSEPVVPEEDVLKPEAPRVRQRMPSFDVLTNSRKLGLLRYYYLELQRAEQVLQPNLDEQRAVFVDPIVDVETATLAVSSYDLPLLRSLPLTYSQVGALIDMLTARVRQFGVAPPASWSQEPQVQPADENGDDEN